MIKRLLTTAAIALSMPGPVEAASNLFTGKSFYSTPNPYPADGCCGYFKMSLSGFAMSPLGNVLVSNFFRNVLIYIDPEPGAPGWFRLYVALADWQGGFNPTYGDLPYGNRVIAYTDPVPWLGYGNKVTLAAQWDMQYRAVAFWINDTPAGSYTLVSSGPNASFKVAYYGSPTWQYGADSPQLMLYGYNVSSTTLGCCGAPQASDLFQFHLWDLGYDGLGGWDYGPAVDTSSRPGPSTMPNFYPLNLNGWAGVFQLGSPYVDPGVECCVTFEDLQLQ